ncbi:hypothetical protein MVEG_00037 [Podila verticillata NRRL 6337]|nr:hypothetical protein MVEG_00037 [Podila verticillata NRRL 6337]
MGEYALVEDRTRTTHKNPIVACVTLHRLEVYFGSVDRAFGKPELIATDPEYRSGDWVRHLMLEMVHPELDTRGDVLQFMPGIPYFYQLQTHVQQDKQHRFDGDHETRIIVDRATGMDVGFAITSHMFLGSHVDACFTRGLGLASLQAYARLREEAKACTRAIQPASSSAPSSHPRPLRAGSCSAHGSPPTQRSSILKVAPELERRLALSPSLARISDMLHGDFFCQVEGSWGKGFEIVLEGGKIHSATEWEKQSPEEALVERLQWKKQGKSPLVRQATFPPLIFSHLLVGRLGLEDLVFGDVSVGDSMTWLVWGTVPQGRSPYG